MPERFILLLGIVSIESLCAYLYAAVHLYPSPLVAIAAWWAWLPKHAVGLFELPLTVAALSLLIASARLRHHFVELKQALSQHAWQPLLLVNLLAFAGVVALSPLLFERPSWTTGWEALISVSWTIGLMIVAITGLWMLAPFPLLLKLLRQERLAVTLGVSLGMLGRYLGADISFVIADRSWAGSLTQATFGVVSGILRLFYEGVTVDATDYLIVVNGFAVRVLSACSGYEGIVLVSGFLGIYFAVFWRELNLSRALWLLPIAIASSWLLNAVRIAAIILLGAFVSPQIAIQGFHSHAGWIFFLALAGAFTWMLRTEYFSNQAQVIASEKAGKSIGKSTILDRDTAFYIPLLALLAVTLVSAAFSSDFQWLYPLRVVATVGALAFCWKQLDLPHAQLKLFPIVVGAGVFVLWLALIPESANTNAKFATQLASVPTSVATSWIVVRCIGAAITVPLAEELAFRGYVMAALTGKGIDPNAPLRFNWLACCGSSLFFGALHGQWLAGTLAGLVYAWVRYRGKCVMDAVLAHAVTNGLLCVYVIATGNWSYW